jgi:hypothetical protein
VDKVKKIHHRGYREKKIISEFQNTFHKPLSYGIINDPRGLVGSLDMGIFSGLDAVVLKFFNSLYSVLKSL